MATLGGPESDPLPAYDRPATHEEVAGIMRRADSMGLCRRRVATALRLAPQDLASVEQHIGPPPPVDRGSDGLHYDRRAL